MPRIILLLFFITLIKAESSGNQSLCNDFTANFDMKKIIGLWYVVAIIPDRMFPENREQVTCYRVEFSETDVAGFRWLVNKTLDSPPRKELVDRIKGTIVRQRYHSIPPFDVWSKSVEGVNGCFQQVLSLDTDKRDINKASTHEAVMQLHLIENESTGPFLLQLLWGRMISVVVYRRKPGVIQDELKEVSELTIKLRGPHMTPKICERSLKDILGLRLS